MSKSRKYFTRKCYAKSDRKANESAEMPQLLFGLQMIHANKSLCAGVFDFLQDITPKIENEIQMEQIPPFNAAGDCIECACSSQWNNSINDMR